MGSWIMRWGPAILFMALIFIASSTPGSDLPDFGQWDILTKKAGHLLGYALLGAAIFRGLNYGRNVTWLRILVAGFLIILHAVIDEWHQSFIPNRSPAFLDVCIDIAGGLLGMATWHFLRARIPKNKKQAKV